MNLTDEQLIEIYHIIFSRIHSDGFMISEVKDLLQMRAQFDTDYWFMDKPNENWYPNLIQYLDNIGFDKSLLHINPKIIP